MKRRIRLISLLLLIALLTGCGGNVEAPPPSESVYAATGWGNPNVEKNKYLSDAFAQVDGFTIYTGEDAASHIGIDVSSHQKEIDWAQVAASGVSYAMIRAGYRGYETGNINLDQYFVTNIQGALDAGLQVGIYFFSQAMNREEAMAEAVQVLEWIRGYDVTYPIVFDWETITGAEARTDTVSDETVTECVKAFCAIIESAGYIPMVYFNQNQGYEVMNLEELSDYDFWLARYTEVPDFEYHFEMWQYSDSGTVPGIEGAVDLNLCFVDYPMKEPEELSEEK